MREGGDWNHYTYVYGEGRTARVDFDVEAAVLPSDDSQRGLRVRWADGSVDRTSLQHVLDGVDAWLVGKLTYAGTTELVLQLGGSVDADAVVHALAQTGATTELTAGWDYFNDRVCPTPQDWRRIQDREALERLDIDGDGELRVLHRFYGDDDALERIRERLADEGFETVESAPSHLTLAHVHPLNDISRITLGLMRLCEPAGVAYDGWVLPG
ncbi:MAG: hypothetical protein KC656_04655 [Myxococcales bacterium]|nr:hypothetical protein [Myxococcales bacterium]MCA9567105.1 hypothetical protein [Myxococcales bacterium]MCB9669437.1 hypothetical protein [Alphaproteobacteria bacterium]MCB9692180.1 hypothetical protein [Alphaproteobacteria bacterium]